MEGTSRFNMESGIMFEKDGRDRHAYHFHRYQLHYRKRNPQQQFVRVDGLPCF
jgi:hypothetical protein